MNKQDVADMIHAQRAAAQITESASTQNAKAGESFAGKDNVVAGKFGKIAKAYKEISQTHAEIAAHIKSRSEG